METYVFKHPFITKKLVLGFLLGLSLGAGVVYLFLPAIRQESFDAGFRSGQWNGFYYSANYEAAAAAQVRMQELNEWEN